MRSKETWGKEPGESGYVVVLRRKKRRKIVKKNQSQKKRKKADFGIVGFERL